MSYIKVLVFVLVLMTGLTACQSSPRAKITVLSPHEGDVFVAGNAIPFTWKWAGEKAPLEPTIYLYSVDSEEVIYGSIPDATYDPNVEIQQGEFGALSYYHVVDGKPDGYPPGFIPGGTYKIKITEYPDNDNKHPPEGYSKAFTIVVP